MTLENVLSKISQSQKYKYCMIPLMRYLVVVKFIESESRSYQELNGGGNGELLFNGYRISVWDD